jgi:hypothetical protein
MEMTTITQNKIGEIVPWGGGGANGEYMQSIILDNGEKEKNRVAKNLTRLHRSESELLKMHALLN